MTLILWHMILGRVFSVALLIFGGAPSTISSVQKGALLPALYLPAIAHPDFVHIGRLSRVIVGRNSRDLIVRGEITSTLNSPIHQITIRVTGYTILGQPYTVVTTTTFLPVTFPGQHNGFRATIKEGLDVAEEVKAEVISWTTATTQTYLTPSFVFTAFVPTPYGPAVQGSIVNDTSVTLTEITIASWSFQEGNGLGEVSVVSLLEPGQTITFSRVFYEPGGAISPSSVHVGVQGIATP